MSQCFTSPNCWGYHFQHICEGDVQNPQTGTFANPCINKSGNMKHRDYGRFLLMKPEAANILPCFIVQQPKPCDTHKTSDNHQEAPMTSRHFQTFPEIVAHFLRGSWHFLTHLPPRNPQEFIESAGNVPRGGNPPVCHFNSDPSWPQEIPISTWSL